MKHKTLRTKFCLLRQNQFSGEKKIQFLFQDQRTHYTAGSDAFWPNAKQEVAKHKLCGSLLEQKVPGSTNPKKVLNFCFKKPNQTNTVNK